LRYRLLLLGGVIVLFVGIAFSSVFGQYPKISIGYLTSIVLLFTALVMPDVDYKWLVDQIKIVLLIYIWGTLLSIIIVPEWSIEFPYYQGYLPWLQIRLHGLTTHAIMTATLAWFYVTLEIAFPSKSIFRLISIILAVLIIFLCQAKTMLFILLLTLVFFFYYYFVKKPTFNKLIVIIWVLLILICFSFLFIILSDTSLIKSGFLELDIENIYSLTGRTKIWSIVFDIFKENPVFGYGPHLWDRDMSLMWLDVLGWTPTHSHNQYLQTLGETGVFGFVSFITYIVLLFMYSWKVRKLGNGVALILIVGWLIRGFTEVWFSSASLGGNLLVHFLIVSLIILMNGERLKSG
jgi:O-antigen ligase